MPRASYLLEDSYCQPEEASPEQNLCAAIIGRVVADITSPHGMHRAEAITWLLESDGLAFFADALGMDCEYLRQQIAIETGLSDAQPRLGERREPIPKFTGLYSAEWPCLKRKRHAKIAKGKRGRSKVHRAFNNDW